MSAEQEAPDLEGTTRSSGASARQPPVSLSARLGQFVCAVRDGDEAMVEQTILQLSRSRRVLAPLAWAVGGLVMLFNGLKLLFSNWRLTLVQIPPAMLIWLSMYDLKAHVMHGNSFPSLRGVVLIPIVLAIMAATMASFFLNAVFGFAIVQSGVPKVRPAVERARSHLGVILGSGAVVGLALALTTTVVTRSQRPWFALTLSVVLGAMMVCYVAVPSRLIGVKPAASRRDKLAASAVGGVMGAVVCTPPYMLGRLGVLMLGSKVLFIPGVLVVAFAATAQAGATGAVKTVKMSAKFIAGGAASVKPEAGPLAASQADAASATDTGTGARAQR